VRAAGAVSEHGAKRRAQLTAQAATRADCQALADRAAKPRAPYDRAGLT
jgi:hypothetical protein